MFDKIKLFALRLLTVGIDDNHSNNEIKRIRLVNGMSLMAGTSLLLVGIVVFIYFIDKYPSSWFSFFDLLTATGAQKVFVTHGFQSAFSRYLTEKGISAAEVKTEYGSEDDEQIPASEEQPVKDTE